MAESSPDLAQLNEAQQSALATYLSVTNQEPTAAIPLLHRSQWNVQVSSSVYPFGCSYSFVADSYRQIL